MAQTSSPTSILPSSQLRSSAVTVADNLDLLTEILLRLPPKSLTQFKSVSKNWLSLISDPQFSFLQYRRTRKPVSALFLRGLKINPEFAFVPLDGDCPLKPPHFQFLNNPGTTILHSCNGLLCYSKIDESTDNSILRYYVCNPTTKQSRRIPLLGLVHNCRIRRGNFRVQHKLCNVKVEEPNRPCSELNITLLGIYVAFDPLNSPHYRIVCVWECNAALFDYEIKIAVYGSEIGSWNEPIGPFGVPYAVCFNTGVFWNGRLHWISSREMVVFDVDEGSLKVTSLPITCKCSSVAYFGESRGHLHLVVNDKSMNALLNVFEMERDYSGWVLKYSCDLEPVIVAPTEIVPNFFPRAFSLIYLGRGEKEDEPRLVLGIYGKLVSYNPKNKTSKNLCDLLSFCHKIGWAPCPRYKAFPYDEVLFEV